MFTGEPKAESPSDRNRIAKAQTPPSPQDQPDEESADQGDWPQQSDDDEILDVLIVDDII